MATNQKKFDSVKSATWFKNVAKSLGYATNSVVSAEYMPTVMDTFSVNKENFKNLMERLKESKDSDKSLKKKLSNTIKSGKDLGKTVKRNALEDFKTGNIYNKTRTRDNEDADINSELGFEDSDDFSFDDNWDDDNFDDSSEVNVSQSTVNIDMGSEGLEYVADAINTQSSIMIENAKQASEENIALSKINIGMTQEMASQLHSGISAINENVSAIIEFNNDKFDGYIGASLKFFEDTTKALGIITESIQKLVPATKEEKKRTSPLDDLMVGGFDLKSYKDVIKKNVENIISSDPIMSQLFGMGESVVSNKEIITDNPIGFLLEAAIGSIMPKSVKKGMKGFESSFKSFIPAFLTQMSRRANDLGNDDDSFLGQIKKYAGKIFGIEPRVKSSINPSKYERGPVPFDGVTRKAIIEVIPTYLSKIYSALSGKEELIFDYENGKYLSKTKMIQDRHRKDVNLAASSYTSANKLKEMMGLFYTDRDQRRESDTMIDEFLYALTKSDKAFNPNDASGGTNDLIAQLLKDKKGNNNKEYQRRFRQSFLSLPKDVQMEFVADILDAQKRTTDTNEAREKSGYSSSTTIESNALSKNNDISTDNPLIKAETRYKGSKKIETHNSIFTPLDKFGKTSLDYLRSITQVLLDKVPVVIVKETDKERKKREGKYKSIFGENGSIKSDTIAPKNFKDPDNIYITDSERVAADDLIGTMRRQYDQVKIDNYIESEKPVEEKGKLQTFLSKTKGGTKIAEFFAPFVKRFDKFVTGIEEKSTDFMYKLVFGEDSKKDGKKKSFKEKIESLKNSFFDWTKQKIEKFDNKLFGDKGFFTTFTESDFYKSLTDKSKKLKDWILGDNEGGKALKTRISDWKDKTKTSISDRVQSFSDAVFGTKVSSDGMTKISNVTSEEIFDKIKTRAPKSLVGGLKGALFAQAGGFGLLGSALLGPFGGLVVGMGSSFLGQSDKFQKFMFGDVDDKGNRLGGIISKSTQDFYKKHKTGIKTGSVVGTLAGLGAMGKIGALSSLVFGGPVAGAILGLGSSLLLKSDKFQEFLFGNDEKGNLGKRVKDKIKNSEIGEKYNLFSDKTSSSSSESNDGILTEAAADALTGAVDNASKTIEDGATDWKEMMFGTFDDNGKRVQDGFTNKLSEKFTNDILMPAKVQAIEWKYNIQDWFNEDIRDPLATSIVPLKEELIRTKDKISVGVSDFFDKHMPDLRDKITTNIDELADKFKKIPETIMEKSVGVINRVGKLVGKVVASPVKLLEGVSKLVIGKQKKDGLKTVRKLIRQNINDRLDEIQDNIKEKLIGEEGILTKAGDWIKEHTIGENGFITKIGNWTKDELTKAGDWLKEHTIGENGLITKITKSKLFNKFFGEKGYFNRIAKWLDRNVFGKNSIFNRIGNWASDKIKSRIANSRAKAAFSIGDIIRGRSSSDPNKRRSILRSEIDMLRTYLPGSFRRESQRLDINEDEVIDRLRQNNPNLNDKQLKKMAKKEMKRLRPGANYLDDLDDDRKSRKARRAEAKEAHDQQLAELQDILDNGGSMKDLNAVIDKYNGVKFSKREMRRFNKQAREEIGATVKEEISKGADSFIDATMPKEVQDQILNAASDKEREKIRNDWKKSVDKGFKNEYGKEWKNKTKMQKDEFQSNLATNNATLDTNTKVTDIFQLMQTEQKESIDDVQDTLHKILNHLLGIEPEEESTETESSVDIEPETEEDSNKPAKKKKLSRKQKKALKKAAMAANSEEDTVGSEEEAAHNSEFGKFGQTYAENKQEAEKAKESKLRTALLAKMSENLTSTKEKVQNFKLGWDKIFSKKGLITMGLMVLTPLVIKGIKWIKDNWKGSLIKTLKEGISQGISNIKTAAWEKIKGVFNFSGKSDDDSEERTNAEGDTISNTDNLGTTVNAIRGTAVHGITKAYNTVKTGSNILKNAAQIAAGSADDVAKNSSKLGKVFKKASNIGKAGKSIVDKESRSAIAKATVKETNEKLISRFITIAKKGLESFRKVLLNKFPKLTKVDNLFKLFNASLNNSVIGKLGNKIMTKIKTAVSKFTGSMSTGSLLDMPFVMYGMFTGHTDTDTANLFQVSVEDVDSKMKNISAFIKGLINYNFFFVFDIVDMITTSVWDKSILSDLATGIYKMLSDDEADEALEQAQKKFDDDYKSYTLEQQKAKNNVELNEDGTVKYDSDGNPVYKDTSLIESKDAYNDRTNQSWGSKAWNWAKGIFKKDNSGSTTHTSTSGSTVGGGGAFNADGSHASGLTYVPKNGYKAILHEGETVLTRAQAERLRNSISLQKQLGLKSKTDSTIDIKNDDTDSLTLEDIFEKAVKSLWKGTKNVGSNIKNQLKDIFNGDTVFTKKYWTPAKTEDKSINPLEKILFYSQRILSLPTATTLSLAKISYDGITDIIGNISNFNKHLKSYLDTDDLKVSSNDYWKTPSSVDDGTILGKIDKVSFYVARTLMAVPTGIRNILDSVTDGKFSKIKDKLISWFSTDDKDTSGSGGKTDGYDLFDSYGNQTADFAHYPGSNKPHYGVDRSAGLDNPVPTFANGTVIEAVNKYQPNSGLPIDNYQGGFGNYVKVRDEFGGTNIYGHLNNVNVKPGDKLNVGDILGNEGNTGNSTGNHLHFETWSGSTNNSLMDPYEYLSYINGNSHTGGKVGYNLLTPFIKAKSQDYGGPFKGQHKGVDLALPVDTVVPAFAEGTVDYVYDDFAPNTGIDPNDKTKTPYEGNKTWGNRVQVSTPDGYTTLYAHLNEVSVKEGDTVKLGDKIGLEGHTGNSTGPHLHLEAFKGKIGNRLNGLTEPITYIKNRKETGNVSNPYTYLLENGGVAVGSSTTTSTTTDSNSSTGSTSGGITDVSWFDSITDKWSTIYDAISGPFSTIATSLTNAIKSALGIAVDDPEEASDTTDSNSINSSGTDSSSLGGNSNAEKIWSFLKSKGISEAGIAGLMGNLYYESGLQTGNLEDEAEKVLKMNDKQYADYVNKNNTWAEYGKSGSMYGRYHDNLKNWVGYGLAQWTSGGRKDKLAAFRKQENKNIDDIGLQLDYLYNELSNDYPGVFKTIKNASSIKEASDVVLTKFEIPRDKSEFVKSKRAKQGQIYYDAYKGKTFSTTKSNEVYGPTQSTTKTNSGITLLNPNSYNLTTTRSTTTKSSLPGINLLNTNLGGKTSGYNRRGIGGDTNVDYSSADRFTSTIKSAIQNVSSKSNYTSSNTTTTSSNTVSNSSLNEFKKTIVELFNTAIDKLEQIKNNTQETSTNTKTTADNISNIASNKTETTTTTSKTNNNVSSRNAMYDIASNQHESKKAQSYSNAKAIASGVH